MSSKSTIYAGVACSKVNEAHIMRITPDSPCGFHTANYTKLLTQAAIMSPNREANADAYATVKPSVTFALTCKSSKGEHIAAEVAETTAVGREPIAGGEIGKSENSGKHREVSQPKTGHGSREAADESRSISISHRTDTGTCLFPVEGLDTRGRRVVQTALSFTIKGGKHMTKLDTMNHRQRAAFARSLYHRPTMTRNAVVAENGYTIKGGR